MYTRVLKREHNLLPITKVRKELKKSFIIDNKFASSWLSHPELRKSMFFLPKSIDKSIIGLRIYLGLNMLT